MIFNELLPAECRSAGRWPRFGRRSPDVARAAGSAAASARPGKPAPEPRSAMVVASRSCSTARPLRESATWTSSAAAGSETVVGGSGSAARAPSRASKALAAAGGQIDKVGNALEYNHATTQFVFYDPALRPQVQALRDAIGVGELVQSDELNVPEDVTVVLGQDYAAIAPPVSATVESGSVDD